MKAVHATGYEDWRRLARALRAEGFAPGELCWSRPGQTQGHLFAPTPRANDDTSPYEAHALLRVPRAFVAWAEDLACHRDPACFDLLYRLLWRLTTDDPHVLDHASDPDVRRATLMRAEVLRDEHKMHAFVRFVRVDESSSGSEPRYVAWYRSDHFVLRRATRFFQERFAVMSWLLMTPDETACWDRRTLRFREGVPRAQAPGEDELAALWRTYYAAVFNPARVNVAAMRKEMPTRFWSNLPELRDLGAMLARAPAEVEGMLATGPAPPLPKQRSLPAAREAIAHCGVCEHACRSKQAVFGEGPARAALAIVGEQPGDLEDQVGRPFVGPAGQLLDRALTEAGVKRQEAYVTNAVKHFRWRADQGRRLHQKPTARAIETCRPWLDLELEAVCPQVILCLGATAIHAVGGLRGTVESLRGRVLAGPRGARVLVTYHPSAILRASADQAGTLYEAFVSDLRGSAALTSATASAS